MVINKREKVKRKQAASILQGGMQSRAWASSETGSTDSFQPQERRLRGGRSEHSAVWVFAANLYDGETQHCVKGVLFEVAGTGVSAVTQPLRKGGRHGLARSLQVANQWQSHK